MSLTHARVANSRPSFVLAIGVKGINGDVVCEQQEQK